MHLSKSNPGDRRLLDTLGVSLGVLSNYSLGAGDVPTSLAEKFKSELFAGVYELDSPRYENLRPFVLALCAARSIAHADDSALIRLGAARLLKIAAQELLAQ